MDTQDAGTSASVNQYASLCAQVGEKRYQIAVLEAQTQGLLQAIDQLRAKEAEEARLRAQVEAAIRAKDEAIDCAGA
jgi:hypothetical protein